MPDAFQIVDHPSDPRVSVLRMSGRLDSSSAPPLAQRCSRVQAEGRDLVLNLEDVNFIASSGVGVLLAIAEQFREAGLSMRLASLSPAVDSVIRLLNLDQFLPIHATEAEALRALEAA